jgi:hypothetical protein
LLNAVGTSHLCHERTCRYSITQSARTSSVGETETAGPRRSPMTELLRQYSPEPKARGFYSSGSPKRAQ